MAATFYRHRNQQEGEISPPKKAFAPCRIRVLYLLSFTYIQTVKKILYIFLNKQNLDFLKSFHCCFFLTENLTIFFGAIAKKKEEKLQPFKKIKHKMRKMEKKGNFC